MSKTGEKTKAMAAQLKVMKVEVKDIGIKMEKLTSKKKTIKENLASTKDMIANLKNTLENMETCQRHSKQKNQCSVSTLPRSPSEDVCQVSALFVDLAARCDSSNTVDVYRFGVLLRGEDVRGKDVSIETIAPRAFIHVLLNRTLWEVSASMRTYWTSSVLDKSLIPKNFSNIPIGNFALITIGSFCSGSTPTKSASTNVIEGSDLLALVVMTWITLLMVCKCLFRADFVLPPLMAMHSFLWYGQSYDDVNIASICLVRRRVEHGFLGFQFSMVEWLNGRSSGVGGCGGG
ncbi:hypothetical protein JHK84_055117 [Glycine max]|nr:hypothetical protein JHK85_056066 [Glycine max]KAG5073886.1 hypothetical protein JHK84_055117 [Glycine max]